MSLSQLMRLRSCSIVNGLKYLLVKDHSLFRLEAYFHSLVGICQTLNTYADRSVPEIGGLSLRDGIVVDVDDLVEVSGNDPRYFHQLLKVIGQVAIKIFGDVSGE